MAEEQHVQLVRSIMHNNIDKMGELYPRFFSSKEMDKKEWREEYMKEHCQE